MHKGYEVVITIERALHVCVAGCGEPVVCV